MAARKLKKERKKAIGVRLAEARRVKKEKKALEEAEEGNEPPVVAQEEVADKPRRGVRSTSKKPLPKKV